MRIAYYNIGFSSPVMEDVLKFMHTLVSYIVIAVRCYGGWDEEV